MNTEEFLFEMYSKVTDGFLAVSYFETDIPTTVYFSPDQLSEMAAFIMDKGQNFPTCININPRNKNLGYCHRGTEKDIACVICAMADLDIKGPAHAEKRLPETLGELQAFIDSLPLKPTLLVFSGNGVHAYWLFTVPFRIESDAARSYIQSVVSGWEDFIKAKAFEEYGWCFDSVSDISRMLRAVGSINAKTPEKPECRVIYSGPDRYEPSDFEKYIPAAAPAAVSDTDDFALMGTGSAKELIEQCTFLQHCRDDAANLSEPFWFAMISNVAQTADGHEMVHELSEPYPRYTYTETERKYIAAAKASKPTTCEFIKKNLCFNCGKDCGVKSPVALVHTTKRSFGQEWEKPIPFDSYQVPDFPVDALPAEIREYAAAVAESTQTPVDLAATAALSILAICLQGKYVIRPKADWEENLNLYNMAFMAPSERKSAVLSAMSKPLTAYEQEWNRTHAAAIDFGKSEKSILERRLRSLEEQAAKGKAPMEDVRKASEELTNFKETKPMRLFVDDVTTEKLVSVMADNDGIGAILSAEAGLFDMLKGIYTRNVNMDVYLKGYSGDPIRVDRVGRESETVNNPTLTIQLMAQPSVLAGIMQNDTFRGRGLTARFLYCMPQSNVGSRRYRTQPVPAEVYQRYDLKVRNLLSDEPDGGPEEITLSPEADELLETFSVELEPKLRSDYADIAEWAGKLAGNVARIAGLLCRAGITRIPEFSLLPEPLVVSGPVMENAIRTTGEPAPSPTCFQDRSTSGGS